MKLKLGVMVIGLLLASSAAVIVTAGPGDTAADPPPDLGASVVALSHDGEPHGTDKKAQVIAEGFGVDPQDIGDLHEPGIGFGVIFKLYALAEVMDGMTLEVLLASFEGGTGLGELRNALTEEQLDALELGPKNLGQLVSGKYIPTDSESTGADVSPNSTEKTKRLASKSKGHGGPHAE